MNKYFRIILTALCIVSAASAPARTILTPLAAEDYSRRLLTQPEVAERIAIPDGLTREESDALKFLYAYIATPDALDYDTDFFLENIRLALRASEEMAWGGSVPDREWRHFVLPVRVNNENLDHSRKVFFEELKPRLEGLSMEEAILEVNHWCHEKVSYQPSDARTSSPLATVANALGRCGEESTFTVAALRSVGIPARQVYTPRWAHTDDNHAWVEAWADGRWHFLGACEPEAVLDLAWFNAPASRGMLMTTKVTGAYDGPEEQLEVTPISTIINVTENYAPVDSSVVVVTDHEGKPLADVKVRFMLYNYAEFYPLAEKLTDSGGQARFTSGLGDMIVWASDGERFNLAPLMAGDTVRMTLDKDAAFTGSFDFDIVPPRPGGNQPLVSDDESRINDMRKAYEDSVRLAYVNTFLSPSQAAEICRELELDDAVAELLVKSRGNHAVIEEVLCTTPAQLRQRVTALLGAVAEKDLHDITPDVIADHTEFTTGDEASPLFIPYVLNPRIETEMLRPYKEAILRSLAPGQAKVYAASPGLIAEDLGKGMIPDTLYNPGRFRQSATATLAHNTADALNRSIAFVAICRSLGVPARIDQVSHLTQYADPSGNWNDVSFGDMAAADSAGPGEKAILTINNIGDTGGREPKYYSQFSISRIVDGFPQLMEFDDFETLESINDRQQPLVAGQYLLVSGQRLADGSVLSRAEFFEAVAGETANVPLMVRQNPSALQVIGSLDAELLYTPLRFDDSGFHTDDRRSILSTTGRGYYVLGLIAPGHEPSAHALNDIAAAAGELASTGRTMLILLSDADAAARFRAGDYGQLPPNVVFGIDTGNIGNALCEGLELPALNASDYPLFIVADSFNRIVFARLGYTINLGETLAGILRAVE